MYICGQHLFVIANAMQLKINIQGANEILTTAATLRSSYNRFIEVYMEDCNFFLND